MKAGKFFAAVVVASLGLAALACGSSSSTSGGSDSNQPPAKDISGTYEVTGVNLDGNNYQGEVKLTSLGKTTYTMDWTIGSGTQSGTGTLSGNTLTADWTDGTHSGTVTYTLQSDGSLSGSWTQEGVDGKGTETLTPKK